MKWVAVLAAVIAIGCTDESAPRVAIGEPAPRYAATTLDGDSASTSSLEGKVVLLNIWATWCAPCRAEIPYLQSLYERHRGNGFEIVGVSVDARGQDAAIREFAKEYRMTYPIWRDPDERVNARFLAIGVPSTYLIDRDGVLRWKHLGTLRATSPGFQAALEEVLRARGSN